MAENFKKRSPVPRRLRGTTTFHPQYGDGRDTVVPILPTRPIQFQTVIPRYRLSASETRDQGVGPFFEEVAYQPPISRNRVARAVSKADTPSKPSPRKIRIDFLF